MNFYIDTICFLYNKQMQDDLGIKVPEIEARLGFHIGDIESVRQCVDDGEQEVSDVNCLVQFKSGETMIISENFEKINNLHKQWKQQFCS